MSKRNRFTASSAWHQHSSEQTWQQTNRGEDHSIFDVEPSPTTSNIRGDNQRQPDGWDAIGIQAVDDAKQKGLSSSAAELSYPLYQSNNDSSKRLQYHR